jgi:hypothetical protein
MPEHPPLFQDLDSVRVTAESQVHAEGFVIGHQARNEIWIYKVSLPDSDSPGATFDNWYREDVLEKIG